MRLVIMTDYYALNWLLCAKAILILLSDKLKYRWMVCLEFSLIVTVAQNIFYI